MQVRRSLATAAASGALIASGLGLALAGPATAAPTRPPSPTVAPRAPQAAPPTVAPHQAPRPVPSAPGIEVPAGNAGQSGRTTAGPSSLEIAALVAGGVALTGGGAVLAIRRRG